MGPGIQDPPAGCIHFTLFNFALILSDSESWFISLSAFLLQQWNSLFLIKRPIIVKDNLADDIALMVSRAHMLE